jgi:serine protease Do
MRKLAVVLACAALLALVWSFSNARAFQFPWDAKAQAAAQTTAPTENHSHQPAVNGAPEPNEGIPLPSWAPLVKRVMPTVVNVAITEQIKAGAPSAGNDNYGSGDQGPNGQGNQFGFNGPFGGFPFAPPFFQFFGQQPRSYTEHGIGSGVIVSPDGYILTNNHVVGHASKILVTLMDKRQFTAKVIGTDAKTDLALIKIDAKGALPYATLGDSSKLQVGDWVLAIGNPFGFNLTVTTGIVSAEGRALGGNYDDFIQTDAAINPGNSGGPLFNTDGQVVGINTAIYSSTGSYAGIGFAIPIDLARSVMDQLKAHGHVIRGFLGVEIQAVTPGLAKAFGLPQPQGALVASVTQDSPAAKAGLQRGDVIVKFNGQTVVDQQALPEMVAQTPIGTTVPIVIIRDGKRLTLNAKVGELHEKEVASAEGEDHPAAKWGLAVQTLTPRIAQELGVSNEEGVAISHVLQDSAAADAGLQSGDVILQMNHQKMTSADQFEEAARTIESHGGSALLLVQRGNATLYTVINPEG